MPRGLLTVLALTGLVLPMAARAAEEDGPDGGSNPLTVRVMSFNLWHGGDAGGQPLEQSARVIRESAADIVGLQEASGREVDGKRPDHGAQLARMLGWHHLRQESSPGIISRFPILGATPQRFGAVIELPGGRRAFLFNVHLPDAPYQPYQLLKIPYGNAPFLETPAQLIEAARQARGRQLDRLLGELQVAVMSGLPVFLTGDFNEPSHLDWTRRAADARIVPMEVEYPTSLAVAGAGMIDAWRAVHPDESAHPGWTWTPITREADPADRHDRIDFVYASGPIRILECRIVGERADRADLVVAPYPSDHRAVVAAVSVE